MRDFAVGPPSEASHRFLPELQRISPTSSRVADLRVNLVIGTLDSELMYGGGRTALSLFAHVADAVGSRSRIISVERLPAALSDVEEHSRSYVDDESPMRSLVGLKERAGDRLPVGPRDVFVATYWSTAEAVLRVREWQRATYATVPRHFLYVIQDYEPGFYPGSAQSMLARSTYELPDEVIAVFNTSLLRDYFRSQRLTFAHEFVFEPRLPAELRMVREQGDLRERTVVVYGRPQRPRNAFPLIVEALRRWHETDARATSWTCVSAGQSHEAIDLGGAQLHSLGKLDMKAYAELLGRSAVGIALMVSPHPSYPPLEMAHLGLLVITNRFGDKDLSTWHENITSLADVTPERMAATISEVCARFDRDPTGGDRGQTRRPDYLSNGPQFPFAEDVAWLLVQGADAPTSSRGKGQ